MTQTQRSARCPRLADLPPAPAGRTGWPWTEESAPLPDTRPDGQPWPRLSIVTPSFRQAEFLEETIRSVLLQGYPDLEYIVIDGGSTDGSVEIIRRYEPWISFWVSEKDSGQSNAINKGAARATADYVAWLNSDDCYLPGALGRAVAALAARPDAAFVYSDGLWVDERRGTIKVQRTAQLDLAGILDGTASGIPQPTVFMRSAAWREVAGLDESLHMAMDLDLWVRLSMRHPIVYLEGPPLAELRFHGSQKTQTRVIEDRLMATGVVDRALQDPRCPPGLTLRGNRTYARNYFDISVEYLRTGKIPSAARAYARALGVHPSETLRNTVMRPGVKIFRAVAPAGLQEKLRRIRGTAP